MKAPTEWLAPPKGAVPLWRLQFAHPDILDAITKAVASLSTDTQPVTVAAAGSDSIQVDAHEMWVQIDEQGAITFRRYRFEDDEGRLLEREEPEDILRPWDPDADSIIKTAWSAGLHAFQRLLSHGEIHLEGRHPSAFSPGRPIPLEALRAVGADETFSEWWRKCDPDYAAGSLKLLSGDRVWGVQIVASPQAARKVAVGKLGPEEVLGKALEKAVAASPDVKTITRERVIDHAGKDLGLSPNAGERVWKRVVNGISDRRLHAIWNKKRPLIGETTPWFLPQIINPGFSPARR